MNQKLHLRPYVVSISICAVVTLLALPLLGLVDLANIVLLFVMAVVAVAVLCGRGPSILASFLSVACFDFFFVPPRFSFTVEHTQYIITFAVMLAVSLVISHLTSQYREKALEAENRAHEFAMLHDVARTLSGALSNSDVAHVVATQLYDHMQTHCTIFLPDPAGRICAVETSPNASESPIDIVESMAVRSVYANGLAIGASTELRDDAVTALLPLEGVTRRRGVLAIHFPVGTQVVLSPLLYALASLVSTAIERIHFASAAQASDMQMHAERLRSSLLAAISHDVRTPLTVIYGLADSLARTEGLPVDALEKSVGLRDQSLRLHSMVENLLEMARLQSGHIVLRRDWQALPEIASESVALLKVSLADHPIKFEWPPHLPLVEVDAQMIERVYCNLLENAAKYSPQGSSITMGAVAGEQFVTGWIANEGEGFSKAGLKTAFRLFERDTNGVQSTGVGIGLAICRAIIEAHGGTIKAENEPLATGARIVFTLPLTLMPSLPMESIENG